MTARASVCRKFLAGGAGTGRSSRGGFRDGRREGAPAAYPSRSHAAGARRFRWEVRAWVRYLENDLARLDLETARLLANGLRVDEAVILGLAPVPAGLQAPLSSADPLPVPVLLTPDGSDPEMAAMQAFRVADRQIGGGYLYAAVVSYLNGSVAPRLLTSPMPSFAAAASLTEMAGWMAHDSGRDDMARAHLDRAWELARVGRDAELQGDVAAARAHLDLHAGDPAAAIAIARHGRSVLARGPRHPGLVARLYAMEARGHAALGRGRQAARLFLHAEAALGAQNGDSSPWVPPFDEGSLASETARGLHLAGDFVGARRAAERVLELRQGDRARSRAFALLSLAQTLLCQRRPDPVEACALARRVVDEAAAVASARIGQQLREIQQLLGPHRHVATVAEYLEATRRGS